MAIMSSLILYHHAVSTCSQKVRICLHEKGLAFIAHQVDLRAKENLSPEYLKLNPNGVVPTLVHDRQAVVDSSVIMEYLDEVFDATALMPTTAAGRARVRAWLRYLEEVPTVAVRYPSYNQAFVPSNFSRQTDAQFAATAKERPLRQHFYERMSRNGFNETDIRASLEALQGTVRRVDRALAGGFAWIDGDQLTLADVCLLPLVDRVQDLGLEWLWADAPYLASWYLRWKQRPAYGLTYYAGSRLSETYADVRERAPSQEVLRRFPTA